MLDSSLSLPKTGDGMANNIDGYKISDLVLITYSVLTSCQAKMYGLVLVIFNQSTPLSNKHIPMHSIHFNLNGLLLDLIKVSCCCLSILLDFLLQIDANYLLLAGVDNCISCTEGRREVYCKNI